MRGTKNVLAKLDALTNAIEQDVPQAIEDRVKARTVNAASGFASADYDGSNDVSVSMTSGSNEWSITASGSTVLFIEYGSGVLLPHTSEFGDFSSYPPASWSATHSGWLAGEKLAKHKGFWPYNGKWVKGNPSANVMYDTFKTLRDTLPIEAKRTVGKALK